MLLMVNTSECGLRFMFYFEGARRIKKNQKIVGKYVQ